MSRRSYPIKQAKWWVAQTCPVLITMETLVRKPSEISLWWMAPYIHT